jgi:hypothetical protein
VKVVGIDFTSCPTPKKPITCLTCVLEGDVLSTCDLSRLPCLQQFEGALKAPGPWIAGIDFPFGQSRKFVENMRWPLTWDGYVKFASALGRDRFCKTLDDYRKPRAMGDKEHRRATDKAVGSLSPQKLYGVPVGKMFFEGAQRLINSGVTVPNLRIGDPTRIVVEAYPGALAKKFIGGQSYKNDSKKKQTLAHRVVRQNLMSRLTDGHLSDYGFSVVADKSLAEDPTGDELDALLCAIQAAWAWTQRDNGFGAPIDLDSLEGWIADPIAKQKRKP